MEVELNLVRGLGEVDQYPLFVCEAQDLRGLGWKRSTIHTGQV